MNQNSENGFSFLLEIGTEDLPARFIPPAKQQLRDSAEKMFRENYIRFSEIKTYGTPRRLAIIAEGIPSMQEDRTREVFGPSKKAAFDEAGSPTKAAIGFAQGQGVDVASLVIRKKDKGEYVAAIIEEKGLQVKDILPEISKKIVFSIHLPKSMRWGNGSMKFIRPVRWLMALFDNEVVNFEIDGIKSGNITRGHRFLSPAAFQLKEISSYKRLLANNCVVVDHDEREKIIAARMEALLAPLSERPVDDRDLLNTVADLVEYPLPVLAAFPEEYLNLPKELLITVMKGHQKYFAVEDGEGRITNHFVVISNTAEENSETVRIGAERVIRARFEDARFYFEEDRKVKLSERVEALRKVTFQESLGSLYDKTGRLASIAEYLARELAPEEKASTSRSAWLAKTDLITGVVREFPELQGVMGKYYALLDGEDKDVATALEEQYLPAHSGGRLPGTDSGTLLSVADKIDNIASFFSIGLAPTGSEDPFALRRQALGIVAMILNRGYSLPLRKLVEKAVDTLPEVKDPLDTLQRIFRFFEGRLENVLADLGYGPDLIQALLPLSLDIDLKEIKERLEAVKEFKEKNDLGEFLTSIKRVNNIIPKTPVPGLREDLLFEEPERKLNEKLVAVRSELQEFLRSRRYYDAISLLTHLTGPINDFFDHVLVMDKREEVKLNRLSLLNEVWKTASGFADFSRLSS